MSDEYTITTRSDGLLGKVGQWGAALITDEELLEALAAHDAEVRAEAESDPAKDERLVRYMAMVTPLGYQAALSVVQQMTLMIQAETVARQASVVTEELEWEYGWHTGSTVSLIGRRDQIDEWLMVRGWKLGAGDWGSRVMRRRVAGTWMPAEAEAGS